MEVIDGRRIVPKADQQAVLLEISARFRQRQEGSRLQRRPERLSELPERVSVAKAMFAVEARLVKAFWTIARLPGERIGGNGRCGIEYIPERGDLNGYADAAGGKWESIAPRPARPSAKDIDDAKEALDWLLLIPNESLRRILVIGATSKRGDVKRGVSWTRYRSTLGGYTERSLRGKYAEAIRMIVAELIFARFERE